MDHKFAIKKQFAERYLLGELAETERDAYEEHFFECQICAEEVQTGSQFVHAAREVFAHEPVLDLPTGRKSVIRGRFWRDLFHPAPAMAFAALVLAAGLSLYQRDEISRLSKPHLASDAVVLRAARGMQGEVKASRNEPFQLEFDVPPGDFDSYTARILTDANTEKASFTFSAQQANDPIRAIFPAGSLAAGHYTMVIQGVNGISTKNIAKTPDVRYPFTLRFQD